MSDGILIVLVSLAAGVVGTGFGGLLGAFLGGGSEKTVASVSGFAAGVMIGLSAFEMVPSAFEELTATLPDYAVILAVLASLVAGALLVAVAGWIIEFVEKKKKVVPDTSKTDVNAASKAGLMRAGIMTAAAIAVHNFPEGVAIGGAGGAELAGGITVAIMIALHNVPEGMAITAPLTGGGEKSWKSVLIAAGAGAATILGAAVGFVIQDASAWAGAVCMAAAAGSMLYVTATSLLPETYELSHGKMPSVAIIGGILCAFAFSAM